ncbi:zinc-ribbon domain-containing protein [Scopulibacillus cellulosilyticus]|uniref:Zinc-ribbon domain-containing protein n=1 Tax=Scopulibacillus cellulosilyticus TaxID=2665665 RepID=A0ABW2Q4L4_9BACL
MKNTFTILECRKCNNPYKVKPEKIVTQNANIQCPHCGTVVNNLSAIEKYYQSINDFKKRLSGVKKE